MKYCRILEQLFDEIEKSDWAHKNDFILQWDGAPAHTSKKVGNYLIISKLTNEYFNSYGQTTSRTLKSNEFSLRFGPKISLLREIPDRKPVELQESV